MIEQGQDGFGGVLSKKSGAVITGTSKLASVPEEISGHVFYGQHIVFD